SEVLPLGPPRQAAVLPAGSSLSLCPAATRTATVRLLAVFLLFMVVRCNAASPAALRRLAVAAAVNRLLLALFGPLQFFSAAPQRVYWIYPASNEVFGPFICRNHFPFYVNLCIGLAVGLLLARRQRGDTGWQGRPLELLHDPPALWLVVALAL